MNLSFYTGATGALGQQERLDIIANNIANINTDGYKSKSSTFSNLIHSNMNARAGEASDLKAGVGVKIEKTDIDMQNGGFIETDNPLDFAIIGEGFFGIKAPQGNQVLYTREGSFIQSVQPDGRFLLATKDGYLVLGKDNQPIEIKPPKAESEEKSGNLSAGRSQQENLLPEDRIAIFQFEHYNDMESVGNNRVLPKPKNGPPKIANEVRLQKGVMETSNVDFAKEMARMIETQRAYQFALRMVTTSDEVEGIINSLRG